MELVYSKSLETYPTQTTALTLPMQEYNVKPVKTVANGAARPATLPNSNHNSGYSTEQADRSVYSL